MELNETLKKYGFTREHLNLLAVKGKNSVDAYWLQAYQFIAGIPVLPPLSEKQEKWLVEIREELNKAGSQQGKLVKNKIRGP